jgi:hypothetical protein
MEIEGPGRVELLYTRVDGVERRVTLADFDGPGIVQGIHNFDASIRSFARACFLYALEEKLPLGLPPRIRSPNYTTAVSRRSLPKYTRKNSRKSARPRGSLTSIP